MTLIDHIAAAGTMLERAGISQPNARFDAELLARHVLGWDRATYLAHRTAEPPSDFETRYAGVVERRARREPVPLITGRREFWGREFEVTSSVLCPRPESELIVEEALELVAEQSGPRLVADAGTGSGCLAVSLAHAFARARLVATDLSAEALRVARRNADRLGVGHRIQWIQTNYLEAVGGPIDLIVSNPPYVPTDWVRGLPPEVRDHEPHLALAGGQDGLEGIRAIIAQAAERLSPGGALIVEFGFAQDDQVLAAIARSGGRLQVVRVREDLQGIPRVAVIRKPQRENA